MSDDNNLGRLSERGRQALLSINRTLASGSSSQHVFEALIREAVALCHAERGFLLDRSGKQVAVAADQGESYSKGVVELVKRDGKPLLTANAPHDPRLGERNSILERNIRSVIAAPLRADGQVIGVIYLDAKNAQHSFSPADLELLVALADQAAVAFKMAALRLELDAQLRNVQEMSQLASQDALTELFNRRAFDAQVSRLLSLPETRYLSLLMIDVDNFKHYNDRNGHPAGDKVLQHLAKLFGASLREQDIAGRYGGEEFIVALPDAALTVAYKVAERLRRTVEKNPFPFGEHQPKGFLSISVGLALFPYHARTLENLIQAADTALYAAKHEGRNRVVVKS
jgi:diguanylate cyclase (GGDEF)-like protein